MTTTDAMTTVTAATTNMTIAPMIASIGAMIAQKALEVGRIAVAGLIAQSTLSTLLTLSAPMT
jgi:hypothetical protein